MPSVTQKLAADDELRAANARIAALEAWISGAIEVYCNQRALITELESQLAAPVAPQRYQKRYQKRDGSIWECVRVGSTTRHYRVAETEPA